MNKHFFICFSFISLIWANNPQTLSGQRNISSINDYYLYQHIDRSNLAYVYGADGDRIIYINFNGPGALISKTAYNSVNKKKDFIFNDDSEERDCHQIIH